MQELFKGPSLAGSCTWLFFQDEFHAHGIFFQNIVSRRLFEEHGASNDVEICQHLLPLLFMGLTDDSSDIARQTLELVEASGEIMCNALKLHDSPESVRIQSHIQLFSL